MESKEAAENVKIKLWPAEISSAGHSVFKTSFQYIFVKHLFRTFKSD